MVMDDQRKDLKLVRSQEYHHIPLVFLLYMFLGNNRGIATQTVGVMYT